MRKVTEQSVQAFLNRREFNSGNTCVKTENGVTVLYLHNNPIARMLEDGEIEVSNCGYETNTTKERLNGVLELADTGSKIFQKNFEWFISGTAIGDMQWDGSWIMVK